MKFNFPRSKLLGDQSDIKDLTDNLDLKSASTRLPIHLMLMLQMYCVLFVSASQEIILPEIGLFLCDRHSHFPCGRDKPKISKPET